MSEKISLDSSGLKYISILKQPKGINYICILNLLLSNDTGKSTIR